MVKVKVARVVTIKLFFYGLILLWFDNTNKVMRRPYKNVDKALLFSRKLFEVFCVKNWKVWRAPTTVELNIILLKLRTRFLLTNVCNRVFRIFFILFRSWVICKNQKRPVFYTLVFWIFIINSRSKQNKKIPNTLLQTLLSRERDQNFSKKY